MAIEFQVTFDCSGPEALARFWAEVLGYTLEDPPEGYESWAAYLEDAGVPEDEWDEGSSIADPDGLGPRIYFQQVSEAKTTKNRLHLDVDVGGGRTTPLEQRRAAVEEASARLTKLGATRLYEGALGDHFHITMADPEGNEFCLR